MSERDRELLASIGMSEEDAELRAEEYERDAWDAKAFDRPRRGRPSIADEEVRPYTVRFPISLMAYVDGEAKAHGHSRSEELRQLVAAARDAR